MAIPRNRVRTESNGIGYRYLFGNLDATLYHQDNWHQCIDSIVKSYGAIYPLAIEHRQWSSVGSFTTVNYPAYKQYVFVNAPFSNNNVTAALRVLPSFPSATAAITQTQADTNPSRPEVSLPIALGELKDLPSMLRRKGVDHRQGRSSSSATEYNFGWGPLLDDARKLFDFTGHVDKRLKELESLHESGLRRKRTTFNMSFAGQTASTSFQTAYSHSIGGYTTWVQRSKQWGSVKWIPSVPFTGTNGDLAQQARLLIHGWDGSSGSIASTIWNLLPWSWAIDYFLNLGDYLDSQRNGAGAIAQLGCVMQHSRVEQQQVITSAATFPGAVVAKPGRYVFETKSRVLATAGLSTVVPFLSGRQLVTLSSIAQSLGRG